MSTASTTHVDTTEAAYAHDGIHAVTRATTRLDEVVSAMDDAAGRAPSLLAGWDLSRLLTHLARNADALVNLLMSAKTGVAIPMYASLTAREADIEAGAGRPVQELLADVATSGVRFADTCGQLPDAAWAVPVKGRKGPSMPAAKVPWLRLNEVLVHLTDLDRGVGFDDVVVLAGDELAAMLRCVASMYAGRPDVPAVRLAVLLPCGQRDTVAFGEGEPADVAGPAAPALSWLTGRGNGTGLTGKLPALPPWL